MKTVANENREPSMIKDFSLVLFSTNWPQSNDMTLPALDVSAIILRHLKLHGGPNVGAAGVMMIQQPSVQAWFTDAKFIHNKVHGGWGGGNPFKDFAIAYSD